ncbi:MAG: hypothetical protein N2316_11320, partial [Spirochaetes bacterium]|nr:hypothetical protein [Spirochaetota bacterium]
VYAASLIILFGAEVAYTLIHPHTYLKLKKSIKGVREYHVIYGIMILHHIYHNFEKGKGATSYSDLLKLTSNKADEVDFCVDLFLKEGLILEKEEKV